ncbi:MAG: branched-chain amino acid ABC transporter permease [Spirochaetes bacterium]|nr:MAG: branched-chain amino acid ABC transporter permease [Spirochaetota bacterium]
MSFEQVLQYIFSGITVGSIYAVVAIGFNIIYNSTGIINFAQGEFVMMGGIIAHSFTPTMPLFLAVVLAVVITTAVGSLIELVFIRSLKNPSVLRMIIITIGLSILIREIALHIWDEKIRALPFFTGSEVTSITIFGAHISPQVLWVLGITALIVVALQFFFYFTFTGQAMRACAANRKAASLCGINTRKMVNLSFCLSAAIGAVAGCTVSPLTQTHYAMGTPLAIKGFTVAILGGLGNSTAAVLAGLLLGLLESFSISLLPMAYKDVIAISILLLILFFRPGGLFQSRQIVALKSF